MEDLKDKLEILGVVGARQDLSHRSEDHRGQGSNSFTLRPTVEGDDGDEVDLFIAGCKVGRGIVHHVDARMKCHSVPIGEDNISVRILEVEDDHMIDTLPFPHGGADNLHETIGIPCKWPKSDVQKVGQFFKTSTTMDEESCGMNIDVGGKEKGQLSQEVDFTKRSNWRSLKVNLFNPDRERVVADGTILVPMPSGVIDGKVLGVANVGITVMEVYEKEYFLHYEGLHSLPTVAWPINLVKLTNDGRFLGDIIREGADESDDDTQVLLRQDKPQKRAYHSLKRTKMDPNTKRLKEMEKRKNLRLIDATIKYTRSSDCCLLKCCHDTSLEQICNLRENYYFSKFEDRGTYMMSLFQNRTQEQIARHMMVLENRTVCAKAFYQIFGFSRSKYYQYSEAYQGGKNVGHHGNEGQVKTRVTTMVAQAALENILKIAAEPMPHLTYNGSNGTDKIEYRLPASMSKTTIWEELNGNLKSKNISQIGHSTFHTIWNTHFANYKIHRSSAFSKCDLCIEFREQLQT